MKTKKKALLLTLSAVLLVTVSVFGTMAYLTDKDTVTNTFTVGNVKLELDEAKVNPDGSYVTDHENRVEGNTYHLIPGHTYIKDPTVTVKANSEDAYVRMFVDVEGIDQLKSALPNSEDTAKYYDENGIFLLAKLCVDKNEKCTWDSETWLPVGYTETIRQVNDETSITVGTYEFRYKEIVKKSETDTVLKDLFEAITVPGSIDNEHLAKLQETFKIVVTAQAIQADGFTTADAAWAEFK